MLKVVIVGTALGFKVAVYKLVGWDKNKVRCTELAVYIIQCIVWSFSDKIVHNMFSYFKFTILIHF